MARNKTTLQKGQQPPGAGRKKGVPNKLGPTALDLIATLKAKGHNVAAAQVEIYVIALKRYNHILKTNKAGWGAATYLALAEKANSELLKYCYAQRKAIEGADGQSLTFAQMVQIIKGDDEQDASD